MPDIKGIDSSDGIRIIHGEVSWENEILADASKNPHYSRQAMLDYLASHTIEQAEEAANKWLNFRMRFGMQVRVHIYSKDPLRYVATVANAGVEIPDNWWE